MPLVYPYAAPWGDNYPQAFAICSDAHWNREANSIAARFKVYRDRASYDAGNAPVLESDVTVLGADVSPLYAVVDEAAQVSFPGAQLVV